MMQCQKDDCYSCALNDDPARELCDKCWRDEKIDRLRNAIIAMRDAVGNEAIEGEILFDLRRAGLIPEETP